MRDLSERDEIREQHADRTGVGHHVERLLGERENAEAYGQDDRVKELDAALEGFGYKASRERKAAAEKKAAEDEKQPEPRSQPPAQRRSPQERQSSAAAKPPQAAG